MQGGLPLGTACCNASVELVKTKYVLFMFSDVVPLHQRWLHELYVFAGAAPRGRALPALRVAEEPPHGRRARCCPQNQVHQNSLRVLPSKQTSSSGAAGSSSQPAAWGSDSDDLGPSSALAPLGTIPALPPFEFPRSGAHYPDTKASRPTSCSMISVTTGSCTCSALRIRRSTNQPRPQLAGASGVGRCGGRPLHACALELSGGGAGVRARGGVDEGRTWTSHSPRDTTTAAPTSCRRRRWPSCTHHWRSRLCPSDPAY